MSFIQYSEIRVCAERLSLKNGLSTILENINLEIREGESFVVTGSSGSGKTSLGRVLSGLLSPSAGTLSIAPGLKRLMVEQQDHFMSLSGRRSTYYGQRYENQGMENTPTVLEYLQKVSEKAIPSSGPAVLKAILEQMQINHIAESKLLQLSNGERKRTQLAAALLQKPDLLVLDQPFVGLDAESRENLTDLLTMQMEAGISLVIICEPEHIFPRVHRVVELHAGRIVQFVPPNEYKAAIRENGMEEEKTDPRLFSVLPASAETFSDIIRMKDVNVTIGGKQILKKINWQVKSGERWALLGHNGAGKTTLLSLVTADNPQGYTNDLVLFDRRRGSGESIWDIKSRIGFVSPELHLYFLRGEGIFNTIPGLSTRSRQKYDSLSCMDVIISGFKNEIGFASAPTDLQRQVAGIWFSILQLDHLKDRLFMHASLGEQRSLFLARALVKSPSLLILDEPCQGLDHSQTRQFVHLLNDICLHLKTTLVYVTHLKDEIPDCIDTLLMLERGQVKYSGKYLS